MEETKMKAKKDGGLFSKLKNIMFSEEEVKTTETTETTENTEKETPKNVFNAPVTNVNIGFSTSIGAFDETFYKSIMLSIEDSNLEGIDYLEFINAKKKMDSMGGLTDASKFQMVFGTLQSTSNITKETLLQSMTHYFDVIEKEITEFNEGMAEEVELQVTSKLKEAESKEILCTEKQAQIEQLQKDIAQLAGEANILKVEASTNDAKIKTLANNFTTTADAIKNALNQDKTSITNYIQ